MLLKSDHIVNNRLTLRTAEERVIYADLQRLSEDELRAKQAQFGHETLERALIEILLAKAGKKKSEAYETMVRARMRKYGTTREVVERAQAAFWSGESEDADACRAAGNTTLEDYMKYFAREAEYAEAQSKGLES